MPTVETRQHDAPSKMFPIPIETVGNQTLELDLYLRQHGPDKTGYLLYRDRGLDFDEEHRQRLVDQGVRFLYVPVQQHRAYRKMLSDHLDRAFHEESHGREERSRVIRATCERTIEDALRAPDQTTSIGNVEEIGRCFAQWAQEDTGHFSHLMDMSSHDYATVIHMINVGLGCGLLIKRLRPEEPDLVSLYIQGGMLHDIGKRAIPEELLNKEGPLEGEEWDLIRRHPLEGETIVEPHANLPVVIKSMVRDHHERLDGSGYPTGLKGDQLLMAVRVCAVIDVYDAVAHGRNYRDPLPPGQVLALMQEEKETKFDPYVLDTWSDLVAEVCERTGVPFGNNEKPGDQRLDDYVQRPMDPASSFAERGSQTPWADERRRHDRFECQFHVRVRFIRQGKRYALGKDGYLNLSAVDLSRSGMKIISPWPLTINDLLDIEFPNVGGQKKRRTAQVVRVRQDDQNRWVAGLRFVNS